MKNLGWTLLFIQELFASLIGRRAPFEQTKTLLNHSDPTLHWGNLGYWPVKPELGQELPLDYQQAAAYLADQLLLTVPLDAAHRVLVLGCGSGQEVLHWQPAFRQTVEIEGWDTDAAAIATAKQNQPQHCWRTQSASMLIAQPNQYDLICALDCAYHFPNRKRLWQAASASLTYQGRMAVSDLVVVKQHLTLTDRLRLRFAAAVFSIPYENWITAEEYQSQLQRADFDVEQIRFMGEQVLDGFVHYVQDKHFGEGLPKRWQLKSRITKRLIQWLRKHALIDYAVIVGVASMKGSSKG